MQRVTQVITATNATIEARSKIHNGRPKNEVGFASVAFMVDDILEHIEEEERKIQ